MSKASAEREQRDHTSERRERAPGIKEKREGTRHQREERGHQASEKRESRFTRLNAILHRHSYLTHLK